MSSVFNSAFMSSYYEILYIKLFFRIQTQNYRKNVSKVKCSLKSVYFNTCLVVEIKAHKGR